MTGRCTFGDLFGGYLELMISMGGDVGTVCAFVEMYEDRKSSLRADAFRQWLENELFLCERCGHEFSGRRLEVGEDAPVVCPPCAKGARRGRGA